MTHSIVLKVMQLSFIDIIELKLHVLPLLLRMAGMS